MLEIKIELILNLQDNRSYFNYKSTIFKPLLKYIVICSGAHKRDQGCPPTPLRKLVDGWVG